MLYRLIDEYTLFYFKFLHNQKHSSSWSQICASPTYHIWTGYAFEGLCLKHISQIKSALGISGIVSNDCSWQIKGRVGQVGAQIDLLIDRSDNCINLMEMKFHEQPFEMTKAYAERLQEKARLFKEHTGTRKNVFITLITAAGVVKNEYYLETVSSSLDLENLFRF